MEASKGGMKVGRIKDPLYKGSYFGITPPPTFIPPCEAPDSFCLGLVGKEAHLSRLAALGGMSQYMGGSLSQGNTFRVLFSQERHTVFGTQQGALR